MIKLKAISRAASIVAMTAAMLTAQAAPTVLWFPQGGWPFCSGATGANAGLFCAGYVPGNETYMIGIRSANPTATAFRVRMLATMPDGSVVDRLIVVDRADGSSGYTSISSVVFGGRVAKIDISVDELGVVGGIASK